MSLSKYSDNNIKKFINKQFNLILNYSKSNKYEHSNLK